MVNLEFRPFIRSQKDRLEQRREQVRRAQKTYRERRDQYLKLLENQLHRYQAENARLLLDGEGLKSQVSNLKRKLDQYEDDQRHDSQPKAHRRNATVTKTDPHGQSVDLRLETQDGKAQRLILSPGYSQQMTFTDFNSPNRARREISRPKDSRSLYVQLVANLDVVVVAMEFILKLESPCLPHIHDPSQDTDCTPQGHVHTVSATLLACMPSPSDAASPDSTCTLGESTLCSRALLAGLLQQSEQLPKESYEVTPVEAWHQIARHVRFGWLTMLTLQQFADQLLEHIKCYGFGGVIRWDFLQSLLEQM